MFYAPPNHKRLNHLCDCRDCIQDYRDFQTFQSIERSSYLKTFLEFRDVFGGFLITL